MLQLNTVLKVGNSVGATFPKVFVDEHNIKPGDKIAITHLNGSITYSVNIPKETEYETPIDDEFFKIAKKVDLKYSKALNELSKLP